MGRSGDGKRSILWGWPYCHVIPHSRITRPRHKNSRSRFFFFHFTAMRVKKFLDLFHRSLYQVVLKRDILQSFFYEFDSRKGDSDLSVIVMPSPGVTLLSKSSHECGR